MNGCEVSLICQFKARYYYGIVADLSQCIEDLFSKCNFKIKKIHVSTCEKILTPSYKTYKSFANPDFFYDISFQSDFNKSDFEPKTRLYAKIDNRFIKGTQYTKPIEIVKFTLVINDLLLLNNINMTYMNIISSISVVPFTNLIGYSFLLPNLYNPISFSMGIVRNLDMSNPLMNLLHWYDNSDLDKLTLGLFNCFFNITDEQLLFLERMFGKENVETIGCITFSKNRALDTLDYDYFKSVEYNELCEEFEKYFPLVRNEYLTFNNQLKKPSL